MNIELRHIRAFVMVANELHFRRAAQKMNLGQPALSRHIKWLEQEVGTKLLSRTTRSVQLTEAGRELVPRLAPRVQANNARFLSGVSTEEQAAFTEIIEKMLKNAGTATEPAAASLTG